MEQNEAGDASNVTSGQKPIEKRYLIADGNPTALIWNCPSEARLAVAKRCLNEVEQVGFVYTEEGISKLLMMGEELCVDAILALATAQSATTGTILAHQVDGPISYAHSNAITTIALRLPYKRLNNTVLFGGIGYVVLVTDIRRNLLIYKQLAISLAHAYHLPAFGIIRYDERRQIMINVYVAETDTFVQETGSGSGSIATSIVTGWEEIIQPSGRTITVRRNNEFMTVEAKVVRYI